ncbi:unnamed protein product, partial [Urochloa humidicola]
GDRQGGALDGDGRGGALPAGRTEANRPARSSAAGALPLAEGGAEEGGRRGRRAEEAAAAAGDGDVGAKEPKRCAEEAVAGDGTGTLCGGAGPCSGDGR